MLCCDHCHDTLIGHEGNAQIDAFLDKALNVISLREIQAFLDKYQLTQKRAAELTGYGEKNISRWLSGHARPSESVSNFLRVLLAEDILSHAVDDFAQRPGNGNHAKLRTLGVTIGTNGHPLVTDVLPR
jgi:DNA-binding transcriptional regulator YiaG